MFDCMLNEKTIKLQDIGIILITLLRNEKKKEKKLKCFLKERQKLNKLHGEEFCCVI